MTESPADLRSSPQLPPLWAGRRRRYLSLLVLSGLGQAAAAGSGAALISTVLRGTAATTNRPLLFVLMATAAGAIGLLRMVERVFAERLSQDYVHEIRVGLLRRNLTGGPVKSLGIAVARTTNDLTSVKNWVSQGVAPLAVGVPLIVGAGAALVWLAPLLALALVLPVLVLLVTMASLAPRAYRRSRELRRQRGKLSSHVADTLLATSAIRSAGGSERELRRIEALSAGLVSAAIDRAKIAGALRGCAAAASGVASAMVVGIGLMAGLQTHTIAGALLIVGILATPIHDLGRVAEYRQTYRAARRIIGPAMQPAALPVRPHRMAVQPVTPIHGVAVAALELGDHRTMTRLHAQPGDRIAIDTGDRRLSSQILEQVVGLRGPARGDVCVDGRDLSTLHPKELRVLVGYAAQGMMLVTGTVCRTVRYRWPDASVEAVEVLLEAVGLRDRVAGLSDGVDTRLVHGGEPLTVSERARLQLARSVLGQPPLLVLDHLDADLGRDGCETVRGLLRDYPGVIIVASDHPDLLVEPTRTWRPDTSIDSLLSTPRVLAGSPSAS